MKITHFKQSVIDFSFHTFYDEKSVTLWKLPWEELVTI
jgi:hypothetical protein